MGDETTAVTARAVGRVQGVNYRAWAQSKAEGLGLRGWVRNEDDGSVTALLIGPKPAVNAMTDAMRMGPGAAEVAQVRTEAADPDASISGFSIQR